MLFLDKLRVKCESFRETESEMVKLLEVLDKHTARHLFRSSHLNYLKLSKYVWFKDAKTQEAMRDESHHIGNHLKKMK